MKSLAIKYRPQTWDDVTEQSSIKDILVNQIETGTIKHGYLFCGGAGTGKTTTARIFAKSINNGVGEPIELDAASNNSVDDIRRLIEQAQTKPLDGKYKVFIIDECHSISNQGFQALLKTLEEPPASAIFIMCTTNPEKIPNTILSRVQRYNFQKISYSGVVDRLVHILREEQTTNVEANIHYDIDAVQYIAKVCEGGMRDGITLMDKCLSFSSMLSVDNVVQALGLADYDIMMKLTNSVFSGDTQNIILALEYVYNSGLDMKQFIRSYFEFILDVNIYLITGDLSKTKLPVNVEGWLSNITDEQDEITYKELDFLVNLMNTIKYDKNPKAMILAKFILFKEEIQSDRAE